MNDLGVVFIELVFTDLVENFTQKVGRCETGAGQKGDLRFVGVELVDERSREHRLATAGLTCEQYRPLVALNRIEQFCESFGDGGGPKEEARVGGVLEGFFLQSPELLVQNTPFHARSE